MGFRPTIGAVYEGRLIDIVICKNYTCGGLLMAAFETYADNRDCKTALEFRSKKVDWLCEKYPNVIFHRGLEPEEELLEFAGYSELPLIVDFTERCIYCSKTPQTRTQLLKRTDSRKMLSTLTRRQYAAGDFLYGFLVKSVIWFDRVNVDEIIRLSREAKRFCDFYE